MRNNDVRRGYAAASGDLTARYEAVSSVQLYAPVIDLLPAAPARVVISARAPAGMLLGSRILARA